MFKKIFLILFALLILCACNVEEPETPVVPEEEEKEEEIVTSADENLEGKENPKIEEAWAKKIYESGDHESYISRINQRIESYKNGTFEEMPNHHPAYPEDFPTVKNLPEANEKNVLLGWKNTEQLSENSWADGYVKYVYIIDENHAIILEPSVLIIEEEAILAFVNTGYLNQNVESWSKEYFDGFFGGSFGSEEAEISEGNDYVVEKEAYELYYSENHKEYLSLINKSLDFHKNDKPDVSSFYPEDFPSPENLPVADETTVLLGWKNFDPENSSSEAYKKYLYVIDKNHAIALTPDEAIFDDKLNLVFSVTEYISGNIGEWVFENFDYFFVEKNGCPEIEQELIAEHVAALNEVFLETFCTGFDWDDETYARLFKTEQVNGTTAEAIPDLMMKNSEIYENGIPEGYYEDAGDADCYLIEDYYNKAEISAILGKWLSENVFTEEIEQNIIEYDGRLYMVRGGRGYGVQSCAGFVITGQTETEITATGKYFLQGEPHGTIDLLFSVDKEKIILESYNINYIEPIYWKINN